MVRTGWGDLFSDDRRTTVLRAAGLGCFFAWFWAALQNPDIPLYRPAGLLSDSAYWLLALASAVAACAGALALSRRRLAGRKTMESGLTLGLTGLYVAVYVLAAVGGTRNALDGVLVAVTGVLAGWLFVSWSVSVGSRNPRAVLFVTCVASVVAFVLVVALYQLERMWYAVVISLLPLVSVGLLLAAGVEPEMDVGLDGPPGNASSFRQRLKLLATIFAQGMAFGLLHALYGSVSLEKCSDPFCPLRFLNGFFPSVAVENFYGFMSIFGVLLAAVVVLVGASILRLNFRKLIYVVGFPLMALGFLVLTADAGLRTPGATSPASGVNFTMGEVVYVAGYYYAVITMWALCSYLARTGKDDRAVLFAWTGLALFLGQFVGFLVSAAVGFAALSGAVFCVIALFLLMLVSLLIATDEGLWGEWGGARPDDRDRPSAFKAACESIARESRLTPRESDVFVLLARGRNASVVAEQLVVTKDTVKTHSRSLYHKLGVHSQQELIDRVEAEIDLYRDQRFRPGKKK